MKLSNLFLSSLALSGLLFSSIQVDAGYRNKAGGNLYGDSDLNWKADPDLNWKADPDLNWKADPDLNPCADPDLYPMGCQ